MQTQARRLVILILPALVLLAGPRAEVAAQSGSVKIAPLGSHAGELCFFDRAIIFEDPTGVRILYDPGRTVDETDPRLGNIDVMLLSHAHADHLGDVRPNLAASGTCGTPVFGATNTDSNFASIAASKGAVVIAGSGELTAFLGSKIQGVRGAATAACPASGLGNETSVPVSAPCVAPIQPGGSRTIRKAGASAGVYVATVTAVHNNGVPAVFVASPGLAPGLSGYVGNASGFVIRFTNGLTAYLTGDTGLFADMHLIAEFYHPSVVVMNMSDINTLGPDEATYLVKNLLRPLTVLLSHINEGATAGGSVVSGTKTDTFIRQTRDYVTTVLALSGVTRTVDARGNVR